MKANEIKVGEAYPAKVTDKVVPVRIEREYPHGAWNATNLATNKSVRIKCAQRLRGLAGRGAKAEAKQAKESKAPKVANTPKTAKEPKAKMVIAHNAAARVLGDTSTTMTTGEMIEAMAKKGYWTSPGGQTPSATLYSAILRELKVKGAAARFTKTELGKFALAK